MTAPRITVLMPVLNAENHLPEALESVWRQTFCDYELLAVDDGSTDRTPEILAACRDPRLRVLRNETRRKLAGALNRGLEEARGEFIARMDADDLMRPDRLALQMAHLERHPEIGCCGGWARTFGDGPRKTLIFPGGAEQVQACALFYSPFAHPTVMFRREPFEKEGLRYDGSYYPTEDYELWSRAIRKLACDNLQRVLVDYRVHGKSMTGGEWSDMDEQTVRVQRRMLAQLKIDPSEKEARLHRESSMGWLPPTKESFARTDAWLRRLEEANRSSRIFDPEALADVLNFVWFRMTMAVVRKMGREAARLYLQSPLAGYGSHSRSRRWIVRGAAWKTSLAGRRG